MPNDENHDSGDFSDGRDPFLGEEEDTPVDRPPRPSAPSQTALDLARFASLINSLATEYGVSAGKVDRLTPAERRVFLAALRRNARATLKDMYKIVNTFR